MRRIFFLTPLIILFHSSFVYSQPVYKPVNADTGILSCQQTAGRLLDEALQFMQKNYYRRDAVRWDELIASAKEKLKTSGNCDDVYETITWCFHQLNETHSFVMTPAKAAIYNSSRDELSPESPFSSLVGEIKGEWLQDSIAYLTIPWVSTDDSLVCMQIADSLQDLIARLDIRGISRWIIDLRKNTGGNCWPMLAGIGPLLGEGVCGYFVSDNEKIPIAYRNGAAFQGRHIRCRVSNTSYRTKNDHHSIIVLTGRRTVSAGEIVALAFKGKEQTYLYGEPTAGLTTANATYSLSDHSMLILSVCQEADHTGRICEGSINPDKYIASVQGQPQEDPVKAAAIRWLQNQ